MNTIEIASLLQPFLEPQSLSADQIAKIESYLALLLKWNAKINLTAVRDANEIVTRHFGESLFAARQFFPSGGSSLSAIDVGSGAGFPGLPMKLWAPLLELTLVESNHRKATFLREAVRALGLSSVSVRSDRAEAISDQADLVTFRAVERFEQILPVAINLVESGGRIGLLIGETQVEVATSLAPEVCWTAPIRIPSSSNRVVLIGEKQA